MRLASIAVLAVAAALAVGLQPAGAVHNDRYCARDDCSYITGRNAWRPRTDTTSTAERIRVGTCLGRLATSLDEAKAAFRAAGAARIVRYFAPVRGSKCVNSSKRFYFLAFRCGPAWRSKGARRRLQTCRWLV